MRYLVPDYVYTPEGLEASKAISISDDGRIGAIMPYAGGRAFTTADTVAAEIDILPGVALLPGFVNTHSHVFQRALRGHTHRPLSQQRTFWTCRRAMYAEAQRLTPELLYEGALRTYREMLAAGYTTVGEFHYVHHRPSRTPSAHPNAMS